MPATCKYWWLPSDVSRCSGRHDKMHFQWKVKRMRVKRFPWENLFFWMMFECFKKLIILDAIHSLGFSLSVIIIMYPLWFGCKTVLHLDNYFLPMLTSCFLFYMWLLWLLVPVDIGHNFCFLLYIVIFIAYWDILFHCHHDENYPDWRFGNLAALIPISWYHCWTPSCLITHYRWWLWV